MKRSAAMARAAMILSAVGLALSCTGLGFIFSSLALILAMLSKGGTDQFDNQGKAAVLLSALSLILSLAFTAAAFLFSIYLYGGWDKLMESARILSETGQYSLPQNFPQ